MRIPAVMQVTVSRFSHTLPSLTPAVATIQLREERKTPIRSRVRPPYLLVVDMLRTVTA